MWKLIATMKRKPGLSSAEFRAYYEEKHIPLVKSHVMRFATEYRRNYPTSSIEYLDAPTDTAGDNQVAEADYDCITEVQFSERASVDKFFAALAAPAVKEVIFADEERFVDRMQTRVYLCEEFTTA